MKESQLILVLGLAGFVVMADNWVVSPILPAIAKSLQVSPVRAGLLISAYMIPFGLFQLVFGSLADRYGKRPVITFSMIFFTIGTALCGFGLGLFDLVLYRAVTGVFAASVMPISLALIGDVVPMERRQQAIGTFMGISFLGQGLSMKEAQPSDLICYCFGYTRRDIEQDVIKNGRSLILEKIAAEKKAGGCDCSAKNPKGR